MGIEQDVSGGLERVGTVPIVEYYCQQTIGVSIW